MTYELTYHQASTYPSTKIVVVESDLPGHLRRIVKSKSKCVILTDEHISALYGNVLDRLSGRNGKIIILPAGEQTKQMHVVETIIEQCIQFGIDRDSVLIAFGGGVISDICGFAASVALRGISWNAVPTTIIGAVDAAVGGKTGVDLASGKNLVGTFYPSRSVIIDTKFFLTLPKRELTSGWGEIIKYGLLTGGALWERLHTVEPDTIPTREIVEECIQTKIRLVKNDLYDRAERQLLNLGHTVGHALETATGFDTYQHGEAVLWGLGVSSELSFRLGHLPPHDYQDVQEVLRRFKLPKSIIDNSILNRFLRSDKKRSNGMNRWVLLHGIGNAFIENRVSTELVLECTESRIRLLTKGKAA